MSENTNQLMKQIQSIFKQAMGNDVDVTMNSEKDTVGEWDSINHLNLVVELESAFNLGLSMEEIEKLNSVQQIVDLIQLRKRETQR
jgi:acyl carrier protein